MPVPVNREEFFELVRKSGVLDEERISTFSRELKDSGTAIEQPLFLANKMIRNGLLTSFQAKQLLQGKWRRFLINGKYKLLELIGTGGMGQVYLCEHIYMRRLVAIKVLPFEKLKDDGTIQRFYREARAAGAVDHPNIVRAFDIDHEEGSQGAMHFLVMEFVDGASLQEIVSRRGPMDPLRAAHYISQAAQGLQHAHEAGLVHRDIKPGNLLLDRKGTVKVLDLGLARLTQASKDNLTERYDENAILGTADYLAPEQARGEAVDIRADIYGLGATFYFLLAGKAPFEEGTITQKLLWSQTRAPKPVSEHRENLPTDMISIIDKMLAKNPAERHTTPSEVVAALEPWTKTPIDPPPSSEMPRRSPASLAPGSQSETPVLPSTPAPRKIPSDLLRSRSNPAPEVPPVKRATNQSDVKRVSARPESHRPASDKRMPARAPRRFHQSSGPSKNLIFAAAGGGAALVVLGIILAWLMLGNKSRNSTTTTDASPVAQHPASPNPRQDNPKPKPPPPSDSNVIAPDQAAKHVNETKTVEMVVKRVGKANTADRYFLNSKENYTDADNFTVTFTKKVLDQLIARGIKDIDSLKNKTIRVKGKIAEYQNRPQIIVDDADKIEVMTR